MAISSPEERQRQARSICVSPREGQGERDCEAQARCNEGEVQPRPDMRRGFFMREVNIEGGSET